jgi:uncharacterized membrane protein (GlpM family)
MKELLIRVLVGGSMVSVFALISDTLTPKRFAGLFSAAPSIALATLILTARTEGKQFAGVEARSMMAGALAFVIYASAVSTLLIKFKPSALWTSAAMLPLWLMTAFGVWAIWLP